MKKIHFFTLLFCMLFFLQSIAQSPEKKMRIPLKYGAHRVGKRTDADMQRWREYGLGQFIHWGVYAIPGGQWNGKTTHYAAEWFRTSGLITKEEYDNLYKQFNPAKFDAKKWAKQAKQMGAKYMIFTTKHHDGFCMWPSKYTDYTIENTPYKSDIVKELVDAYTAEGIDVYLYFSIIDWSHPGYQAGTAITNDDRLNWAGYTAISNEKDKAGYETFKEFTRNQLIELLTNYPTVKGLWFDGSWDGAWMKEAAWVDALGTELRDMHPGLIIGSRFRADENGKRHEDTNGDLIDDYDQRFERNLPNSLAETKGFDWDCVMTIPENQWGYHRDWSLTYVKTPYDLIEMTVKANSLDGNFVINFGPDGDGNIRQEETDIAKSIGNWMSVNGDAVYGVQHSVLEKQDWGHSTAKGDITYLTVFNKPMNNLLKIKVPRSKEKDMIYVIESAMFKSTKKAAVVRDGGRDKSGSVYYDIVLPADIQKLSEPFVIEIKLKQVNKGEKAAYQQALT
ncbi:alpha-L-fucosidase [Dysgonomonas sp. UBA7710]|uniref:alpha-L-fucosidase n=2 Tax=unclassified Dysgonomonas TaxID=2630389 RepID=UPI0025C6A0B0|nr:alpha-L-fucosidase [Dysgonomonas sp. UBA7710]